MRALLLSGGLDSTALAFLLKPDKLLFIDYGQRAASGERRAARQIASHLGLVLDELRIDCGAIGTGQMADGRVLPGYAPEFWPFRNQLLITFAAARYVNEEPTILIGSVIGDGEHPDGTEQFVESLSYLLKVQGKFSLEAPALKMTALELLELARVPNEILAWTISCHVSPVSCGQCRGCHKHYETLRSLQMKNVTNAQRKNLS